MDKRVKEDSKDGAPPKGKRQGRTIFALVVAEIVRRKCLEKDKISREELEMELKKIYSRILETDNLRNQVISWGIIFAGKGQEGQSGYCHIKTDKSEHGTRKINEIWFDSSTNDIKDTIIDIEPEDSKIESESAIISNSNENQSFFSKKQIILYGPPGTGKTYNSRRMAVDIMMSARKV